MWKILMRSSDGDEIIWIKKIEEIWKVEERRDKIWDIIKQRRTIVYGQSTYVPKIRLDYTYSMLYRFNIYKVLSYFVDLLNEYISGLLKPGAGNDIGGGVKRFHLTGNIFLLSNIQYDNIARGVAIYVFYFLYKGVWFFKNLHELKTLYNIMLRNK